MEKKSNFFFRATVTNTPENYTAVPFVSGCFWKPLVFLFLQFRHFDVPAAAVGAAGFPLPEKIEIFQ